MPLYEYLCTKCGHRFELIRKFSDPPVTKCPKCKGKVEKLISAPAIQFKGSGWYVSDYGKGNAAGTNKKPGAPSEGEGGKGTKPEGKTDTSSETKPASSKSEGSPTSKPESKTDSNKTDSKKKS